MEPVEAQELAWLNLRQNRTDGLPRVVADVLPGGYPSYCRLLTMLRWPKTRLSWEDMKPQLLPDLAAKLEPEALAEAVSRLEQMTWPGPEQRWSEVAVALGIPLTGETTPADLAAALPHGERDDFWEPGTFGGLTEDQLEAVYGSLRSHTSGDELYMARWEGIGVDWRPLDRSPTELRPGWRYYIFRVALAELSTVDFYGHVVWPDDRAWVLNDDVNTKSIYVAGSASLADDLTAQSALDCYPVGCEDPAW